MTHLKVLEQLGCLAVTQEVGDLARREPTGHAERSEAAPRDDKHSKRAAEQDPGPGVLLTSDCVGCGSCCVTPLGELIPMIQDGAALPDPGKLTVDAVTAEMAAEDLGERGHPNEAQVSSIVGVLFCCRESKGCFPRLLKRRRGFGE